LPPVSTADLRKIEGQIQSARANPKPVPAAAETEKAIKVIMEALAREVADEHKAVLDTVSEGVLPPPGSVKAQGKPDSNRKPVPTATEVQKAIKVIMEALANEVADEHKALLDSINDGVPSQGTRD
jgi:3-methyladenine DNA glycosylase AlkD